MATNSELTRGGSAAGWTRYLWAGAALLLLLPFIAMRFTAEVDWNAVDFAVMGTMLALACGAIELAVRASRNAGFRLASLLAVGASFLVIWSNLAVGIVGSEDNPANLLFFVALLMGLSGTIVARFDSVGMARAMTVSGIALLAALLIASAGPHDEPLALRWVEVLAASVFTAMFLLSAALYAKAARD